VRIINNYIYEGGGMTIKLLKEIQEKDEQLLMKRIALEALVTEREAYIALNQYRISRNETIAYRDEAFFALSEVMMKLLDPVTKEEVSCQTQAQHQAE
jgi:hypothetical protein